MKRIKCVILAVVVYIVLILIARHSHVFDSASMSTAKWDCDHGYDRGCQYLNNHKPTQ